jgi:ABC-type uncharacterized transport system permease subunit
MPPTDMKLISAIIVALALSMGVIRDKVVSLSGRQTSMGKETGGQR